MSSWAAMRFIQPERKVWWRLALALAAGVAAAGSAVGLLATSAWLITTAAAQPPVLILLVPIVAVRAFGVARGVFRYVERLAGHDAAYRVLGETRARITARLEQLAPGGLSGRRQGDLLARLVLDVDAVLDLWLRVLLPVAVAAVTGTATVALIALLLPTAGAAVAVAVLVACTVVPWLTAWSARRAERSVAGARGEVAAAATETLLTAGEVIAFNATDRVLDAFSARDARLAAAERRSAWSAGLGGALLVVCVGGASIAGLVLGSTASITGAVFAVLVLTPLALADVLGGVPAAAQLAIRVRSSLGRVQELVDSPEPVAEPRKPVALPQGRGLQVRQLRVGYGADSDVLSELSLDMPAGSRVVITGPSGAGKSTLAAVLLRFLEPRAGQVLLDGVDLASLEGDQVRSVVGLLTQESHVFDTTIRENLLLADPGVSDLRIWRALYLARLGAFVEGLADGLDTLVGEHGARLSGGQRQRLAFARLLLAQRDVLVLDEPTEHLDEETGRALLADLFAAAGERTVVLLTHRPELVPDHVARQEVLLR
ncbi:thiol reductant ABC exporter subunit CydC [Kribbella sandramycini]|uniref:ATP-binding cassette subfamily C protein CydC n=1 Tax=Kribbella sandramycini TaxID=60450 RepID=A0A7Y4L3P1_9ACTN|nr:thiol reductant ABC exporter subunit CydC [Kribbella sandramycini]MBB6570605.1 ATP-binding cassette subfamily C protein CydC [Kribbella sandramycini]NOL43750.1 thiol reductant ABC exporter subunit CydC [Kribbella sandramycini]